MNSPWYKMDLSKTSGLCLKAAVIVLLSVSVPLYLTLQGFDWYADLKYLNGFVIERAAFVIIFLFGAHLWCYLVYRSMNRRGISNGFSTFLAWVLIPLWFALFLLIILHIVFLPIFGSAIALCIGVVYSAMAQISLMPSSK